ncbi:MAG: phage distal tail protein, Rcc01695 family [Alphaproteobacteria bacterium]
MAFHEIRFPTGISLGASGGPERRTEIVTLASGYEERNSPWADSRRRYNAGYGVRSLADIHQVIAFFEARSGRLHGFRFKDFSDFQSPPPGSAISPNDQIIGTGDGVALGFQLYKNYISGSQSYARIITKPVDGSVRVALDGVEQSAGLFTVDSASGIVTFSVAPGAGVSVSAGFTFDVPVRFDADFLEINRAAFNAGQIPNIPLVEVRL